MFRNHMVGRGTSPMPFERYDKLMADLGDGEYAVMNRLPERVQPPPVQHHYWRNGLMIGGLGAGIGAMYRYRQPLLKLGQKVANYASDKFHNLFHSSDDDKSTTNPNPHNW